MHVVISYFLAWKNQHFSFVVSLKTHAFFRIFYLETHLSV